MRWWGTVALCMVTSALGCTRTNPEFGDGDAGETRDVTSEGSDVTTTTGDTTLASDSTSNTTSTTDVDSTGGGDGSSGTTGGLGDWQACPALVYAITVEQTGLLLVDLDSGDTVRVADGLGGAALATDPSKGDIYGWPYEGATSGFVAYVGDPFTSEWLDALERPNVIGAAFDAAGTVWMLTDSGTTAVAEYQLGTSLVESRVDIGDAFEGDLVIVDNRAVVFTDSLSVRIVDLDNNMLVAPVDITGLEAVNAVTGAAKVEGAFWISTRESDNATTSDLWRLDHANDLSAFSWAEGPITVPGLLTDLAPVYGHQADCEAFFALFDGG